MLRSPAYDRCRGQPRPPVRSTAIHEERPAGSPARVTTEGGLALGRRNWDFIINKMIDDLRGNLRLLTIVSLCFAIGTVAYGIAEPAERSEAMAWALFVAAFAAICGALWAGTERWHRARAQGRKV